MPGHNNTKINTSILQYQQYQNSNTSSPSMYTELNVNTKGNSHLNNNKKLDSVNTFNSI